MDHFLNGEGQCVKETAKTVKPTQPQKSKLTPRFNKNTNSVENQAKISFSVGL